MSYNKLPNEGHSRAGGSPAKSTLDSRLRRDFNAANDFTFAGGLASDIQGHCI